LAEKLGESTQTVSNWVARGRISATAALKVEEFTSGKFKASEMRPDVKQWRNK
jgi:DNA-binding transcriptional regulator YdaS (Cro superfamily)